jgi:hypothetical protein
MRHHRQADTLFVAVVQKGIDGTAVRPCQKWPQEIIFAWKAAARASTLIQRLMQLAPFESKNPTCER